eukprot:TRINITY_DN532_c1_g1_i1.p1 TRINITY_DN532_c1_g1~~TRINITY_DN532_c1_g1_i1.p1  ORF type:complete len:596 (+),score=97.16 TRINITY_DN532_c1_g1_i1:148-1788(+)
MPGATITLVGSGFGTLATNATVSVNGTACSITVFTPLHIECTPSFVVGSRGVTVSRKGFGTSNMLSFVVQITATRTRTVTRQTRTRTRTESHQTRSRSRTSTRQTRTRTLTRTRTRTRTNFLRPDISSITPAVVLIGATVVISGINFGTAANATIGGVPCVSPTVTGSGTQLTCVVPAVAPGVQPIRVSCNGLFDQSARSLTVVQPFALSQLSPPEGQYGTLVNISAAGLLGGVSTLTPATVTVLVSGTAQRANVTQVSPQWLTALMPPGVFGSVAVSVQLLGAVASSNIVTFAYIATPTVADITPRVQIAGGLLTVICSGFGSSAGGLSVTVGGFPCNAVQMMQNDVSLTCTLASLQPVGNHTALVSRYTITATGSATVRVVNETTSLLALYSTLGGASWANSAGWGVQPCCSEVWFGVTCNSNGRVAALTLVGNGLAGVLPTALADLSELISLNLSSNYISGGLAQLCALPTLSVLDLQNNTLVSSIPACLATMPLQILDLSRNSLTATIPPAFGYLSSLTSLALAENHLGPAAYRRLCCSHAP